MRDLAEAPFLDVFGPAFQEDPGPVVEELRRESWVVQTAIGCLVIGRAQVHTLLSDPRLTSALGPFIAMQGVTEGPIHDMATSSLLGTDGEDHARIRRLVSRSFTPRSMERHRDAMRAIAADRIARFAGDGQCEFMSAFADHFPAQVICHVLGVPDEDHESFASWGDAITHSLSLELSQYIDECTRGFEELNAYLDTLIEARHAEPRDDLVSELIAASEEGDRLSNMELRSLLGGLLFAGYDTTRNQLGLAMNTFCDRPDQWRLLAERPELAERAVEEVLRTVGTVSVTPRLTNEDLELDGWRIPAGTLVSLSLAGANHDPAAYDDPYELDITVEREPQFTFGGGPHYCLGASLARAELQEAMPLLAAAMRDMALDGEPEWRSPSGIYGPTKLPLKFTPASTLVTHGASVRSEPEEG